MSFFTRVAVGLFAFFALVDPTIAQSPRTLRDARPAVAPPESQIRDRLNAGTIGLAAGLLEGAPIHFATEIARVVNEGGDMQV
ncbi:MAG: TAXI family TRAP transporter solute-binding subunit, partial [Xanthobacteraceae bacterium]